MGIFNADGGIVRGLGKIVDIVFLSILFLICSIPIFTTGTAVTALYYTVNKVIKNDRGYVFREYMGAFRNNFKQTTPVWLLSLVIFGVLGIDIYLMYQWAQSGSRIAALIVIFLIMTVFFIAWTLYVFAYMARFENTRKQSMKNALLIALANLGWTLLLIAMVLAAMLFLYLMPVSILFLPGLFTLLESYVLERIFWKYMSEEDRKAELERNREFKN